MPWISRSTPQVDPVLARLTSLSLLLPAYGEIWADRAELQIAGLGQERQAILLSASSLGHRDARPWHSPFGLSLALTVQGDNARFDGEMTGFGEARLGVGGQHDLAKNLGRAVWRLRDLAFGAPGQMAFDLSPRFAAVVTADGELEADGEVVWRAGDARGRATVSARALSLRGSDWSVNSIEGSLALGWSAAGLATPGLQRLQAAAVHLPQVFLGRPTIEFALSDRPQRLTVHRFEGGFLDGQLALVDTVLTLGGEGKGTLQVADLSLEMMLSLLDVDGLGGEGRISGSFPLRYRAGALAVEGAQLFAPSPGRLRLISAEAGRVLEPAGISADLLLGALEDFHYRQLAMEFDKAFDGESVFRLKLAGGNPDYRNGQRFNLNLNLSTNLDRLLAPLLQGLRLSDKELAHMIGRQ